jgi:hypothetical protein
MIMKKLLILVMCVAISVLMCVHGVKAQETTAELKVSLVLSEAVTVNVSKQGDVGAQDSNEPAGGTVTVLWAGQVDVSPGNDSQVVTIHAEAKGTGTDTQGSSGEVVVVIVEW